MDGVLVVVYVFGCGVDWIGCGVCCYGVGGYF